MKTLVTLMLLTLICFLRYSSTAPVAAQALFKQQCCQNCNATMIPRGRVRHVESSPSHCTVKAVIVTSVCGKKICIDPNTKWTQKLLSDFKMSMANKTSPSPPFNVIKCPV
ncbi:C-C motif chemokine 18-like [Morone saxatilis]|uniref:C-C motif chemokine 18-like n=1 Tax=Morone saxatilis TaxID=34816 RepID=UPI0015E207B0|nr:C-C motif chemokine 18-like [Morone saxatilis]